MKSNIKKIPFIDLIIICFVLLAYVAYKLHDFTEPFAYGHTRWSDATFYWFGMMHLDLGYSVTKLMNVEGIMDTGELIFYKTVGPLEGVFHSFVLKIFDDAFWAVRVIPLLSTLLNFFLLAIIGRHFFGSRCYLYLAIIYFACPFVIKYGSSDVGFAAIPTVLGLAGWVYYLEYLKNKQQAYIFIAIMLFSVGVFFSWLSAFMGLPVYLHILFSSLESRDKVKILLLFSMAIMAGFSAVLIHQGLVSNEYIYPVMRAIARSKMEDGMGESITWGQLFIRQLTRAWQYFGQITSVFFLYWLTKLMLFRGYIRNENLWILGYILSGLYIGFLARNAAYMHDYLMLGFLPGVMLAAVSGGIQLSEDLKKLSTTLSVLSISFLLVAQLAFGMKSAIYFEQQEQKDILNGEASVAWFLEKYLTEDMILAGDFSSGYHKIAGSNGVFFQNLKPHLAYLTRLPVRYVESVQVLEDLRQGVENSKDIVFVQLSHGPSAENINIPEHLGEEIYRFNGGRVFLISNNQTNKS